MRFLRRIILAIVSVFVLISCKQVQVENRPTIQIVEDILADKSTDQYSLLNSFSTLSPDSDISIIGNRISADGLADYFLSFDRHDNVNGSRTNDFLPDFAGETFNSIGFEHSFKTTDTMTLRNLTVLTSLASLDTLIHLSPYDVNGVKGKRKSKIVILTDPYMSSYGLFDCDTLFQSTECATFILSSIDLSIAKVFENNNVKKIGIFYNKEVCEGQAIIDRFKQYAPEVPETKYISFCTNHSDSLFRTTIDSLIVSHSGIEEIIEPFDAIIIDDYDIDIESFKNEYAQMISVLNPNSLLYTQYFSDSFQIIDTKEIVANYCFALMREHNLFTHNIAYPQINLFSAIQSSNHDNKIILVPYS